MRADRCESSAGHHIARSESGVPTQDSFQQIPVSNSGEPEQQSALQRVANRRNCALPRNAPDVAHDLKGADELVHAAFLKAYQTLDRFRDRAQFSTWLVQIVLNAALLTLKEPLGTGK